MNEEQLRCAEKALEQVPDDYRKVNAGDVAGQERGHSFHQGMHIGWAWGEDVHGRSYLDFLSEHRHPGMQAQRYFTDGRTEPIATPASTRRVSPDPLEDAEIERKFFAQNRAAYANLRDRGLLPPEGENVGSQNINEFLLQGGSPAAGSDRDDTDYEALSLLADIDLAEAAELTAYKVAHTLVRERARAVSRANAYLNNGSDGFMAHEPSARYNPVQKLWIIGYRNIERPDEILMGGPLIVPDRGPVYRIDSMPKHPEYTGIMAFDIPGDWFDVLQDETDKPYWDVLERFIADERANPDHEVYPAPANVFNALKLTPFLDVRVVVVGQDPYINPGEANGLAFSVPAGIGIPPSLRTIRKELAADLDLEPADLPEHGDLTAWAEEGVLLLNTTLTVRRGESNSHTGVGWETFTDAIIRAISDELEGVVFILWGGDAQEKETLIDQTRHPEPIKAAHPRARATARNQFAGSKPFTTANRLLAGIGRPVINWSLETPSARER
jgi:uracil-DNA glycosylase